MINKEEFKNIEEQLDPLIKAKQIKTENARNLLNQYFSLIIEYFKQVNQIEKIDKDKIMSYPVVPMNFKERLDYIEQRKHHFMGYRQMVTLKEELIKMNARHQLQLKRKKLKNER